jgi:putative transposase
MVTAGTYQKTHFFREAKHLAFLNDQLLELAEKYDWRLQAWAVFSNHYHFVALAPEDAKTLKRFTQHLHSVTAREINRHDGTAGRQIWHLYWDTQLTYEKSYLARVNYVHNNAVHHRLVATATAYPWCSAAWFEQSATPAVQKLVGGFRYDKINVEDDF